MSAVEAKRVRPPKVTRPLSREKSAVAKGRLKPRGTASAPSPDVASKRRKALHTDPISPNKVARLRNLITNLYDPPLPAKWLDDGDTLIRDTPAAQALSRTPRAEYVAKPRKLMAFALRDIYVQTQDQIASILHRTRTTVIRMLNECEHEPKDSDFSRDYAKIRKALNAD